MTHTSAASSTSALRHRILSVATLLAALAVSGCKGGASVTVDISVPRPLVEPMGVAVGMYFNDELKNYIHEEDLADFGTYSIDIGASQASVFAQVFEAMFGNVVPMVKQRPANVSEDDGQDAALVSADGRSVEVEGVLAPSIEEVQFALPDQTGGDFYEVWIRYRMEILDTNGKALAEWPLIGYGKANQRNYGSLDQKEAGLYAAAIWALRDAAAVLSFQFHDQTAVQGWLASVGASSP